MMTSMERPDFKTALRRISFGFSRETWGQRGLASWLGLSFGLLLQSGCEEASVDPFRVEVGVFYGGQVQKLARVEIRQSAPPTLGFRVFLPSGRASPSTIIYEVVSLGAAGRRVKRTGELKVAPERRWVDQVIPIPDDARLGLWNIRVLSDQRLLADRALFLTRSKGS